MTDSTDRPPDPIVTRLEMMTYGAALVMAALLIVGALVTTIYGGSVAGRNVGLHMITMGVVMVIAVGAAANHKAIIERQQRTDERLERLEDKLGQLEEKLDQLATTLGRLLATMTPRDEISAHRNGHHR